MVIRDTGQLDRYVVTPFFHDYCFRRFQDVGDAAKALDEPRFSAFKADAFFDRKVPTADGGEIGPRTSGTSTEVWSTREFESALKEAVGAAAT